MDMGLGRLQQLVMDTEVWRGVFHGVAKSWTWLSNWTELIIDYHKYRDLKQHKFIILEFRRPEIQNDSH